MAIASDLRLAIFSSLLLSFLCFCSSAHIDNSLFLTQSDGRGGPARSGLHLVQTETLADTAQETLVCKGDGVDNNLVDDGLQNLCPVTCFRPDPVCGEDEVTYWCGCREARCAGVAVSHVGFCKIRSSATAEKGSQALLLLHALWLALLGFSCLFGLL